MRTSFLLLASLLLAMGVASTAAAQHAGQIGLSVVTVDYPIGLSYGFSDKATGHLGVGFTVLDDKVLGAGDPKTRFGIAGAVNYDIWQATGSHWGFGLAPALTFDMTSFQDGASTTFDSDKVFDILLALGGHWDPMDNMSFWFRHGVVIDMVSPGDVTSGGTTQSFDSTTNFGSTGDILAQFGWTAWFGG
jgi:hypothetical protein